MTVHTYRGPEDIHLWLAIRNAAFAEQIAGTRPWDEADFRRDFLEKPWWRPDWMWFAEPAAPDGGGVQAVGVVALKRSLPRDAPAGSVQWLAVLPAWRRQGVGRLLMATLERAAWEAGLPVVTAETLREWDAAVRFYQALGYRVGKPEAS